MTADQLDAWYDALRSQLMRSETRDLADANLLRLQIDQVANLARTTRKRESIKRDAFQQSRLAAGVPPGFLQRNTDTGEYVNTATEIMWRNYR